jgi:tRNA-splicing ligase RtcB (3'-phosphate/5'-hydroxy nucleic acid ligase)
MPKRLAPRLISWASILDAQTEAQAVRAARMPFVHPHIALMPDAHLGKGATVGSVIPTERAIIPAAVGVDIGCGMIAVQTQFQAAELPASRAPLRKAIEASIPLGAGQYNTRIRRPETSLRIADLESLALKLSVSADSYAANWREQLGSLGSGNHFIEVSLDQDDRVWMFLHSGSRGIGNKIAKHHIAQAQDLMKTWWIDLPDPDLAYLVEGTQHFDTYIAELTWAQEFARLNRAEMMARVRTVFEEWIGGEMSVEQEVNCHHNYTVKERHFGHDVWLSRKGAIDASLGTWGLIPGSMGTRSYVVQGKGNRLALNSAPHGAGRNYSRSAARKRFTVEELRQAMAGIEYRDTAAFIDEIPQAYKPIDVVMEDARDLVDVRYELRQIVNVKGD